MSSDLAISEAVTIQGDNGNSLCLRFIEVYGFPDSTCSWGGYEVRAAIKIKSGSYRAIATLWTSTGELHTLLEALRICNEQLSGEVQWRTYEHNLELVIAYDKQGHVIVSGNFIEYHHSGNELQFKFATDQTYMSAAIAELHVIAAKYGGMEGVR